jgi:prepilin-type N-terminal cleavage/methylation domain-containing protein
MARTAAKGPTRMSAIGNRTGDYRMGLQASQQLSLRTRTERRTDACPPEDVENGKSQMANCRCPNGRTGRARGCCSAFTLIELMVVIVLIGIMTAMILPEMKGTYEDALLRSTGRELVSVCGLASSHAVSVNQAHRLHLDPKTGHYSIEKGTSDRRTEGRSVAAREVPGGEGELDTRIAIEIYKSGDEATDVPEQDSAPVPSSHAQAGRQDDGITFYPDGTADASEIVLRDRDGFRLALRINPVTARVRIIELARE